MNGQNYVVFHNDSDDSYMNSVDNFRGAETAANVINVFFQSATTGTPASGYDKIVLAVGTAGNEEAALEAFGAALSGAKNPVTIVADDKNSVYCHDFITGVTSITLATQGQMEVVEAFTPAGDRTGASDNANTKQLTAADSGKIYMCNISSNTAAFRLPAVSGNSGVNYTFVLDVTSDAAATKDLIISSNANGENIIGAAISGGAAMDVTVGTSMIMIDSSDCGGDSSGVSSGDRVGLFCDGTNWYLQDTVANPTASFDIADAAV